VDFAARPLILFDGVCHLCNRFVQFVLRRDREGAFDFAPLQSALGRSALGNKNWDSVVLVEGGRHYEADAAVLRILSRLPAPWPQIVKLLRWWPKPLLRWGYRLMARHRYAVFGRDEVCAAPGPEWKSRLRS
jgi:predicted DCC family thiol-disulfide oxidoreductase YuxK